MKKCLKIEFYDGNGNLVPTLSKCPATPEMVMSCLHFLADGMSFTVSVSEFDPQTLNG